MDFCIAEDFDLSQPVKISQCHIQINSNYNRSVITKKKFDLFQYIVLQSLVYVPGSEETVTLTVVLSRDIQFPFTAFVTCHAHKTQKYIHRNTYTGIHTQKYKHRNTYTGIHTQEYTHRNTYTEAKAHIRTKSFVHCHVYLFVFMKKSFKLHTK